VHERKTVPAMSDLAVALGLVLVIEGTLWALAPGLGRKFLQATAEMPESNLRLAGAVAVAAGVALIWLIRG
jgi:uncharacterized protein YjeT (DUF2065 family)